MIFVVISNSIHNMLHIILQGKVDRNSANLVQLLDEYSIVIQEYFQAKVDIFMATVGKDIFGIEHYWGRFEFASMRGQIHLHLLGITADRSVNKTFYDLRNDKSAQAKFLHEWSKGAFRYSAEVNMDVYQDVEVSRDDNPCQEYYEDIDEGDHLVDESRLWKFTQNHECSGYCLRYSNGKKTSSNKEAKRCVVPLEHLRPIIPILMVMIIMYFMIRTCRSGAGKEQTAGAGDTPGFVLQTEPSIVMDPRGYPKLEMPRNHQRIVQSSLDLMCSWRANCDVQILLYDCDPDDPDPSEIARVTDYVVAYACKGNESLREEKEHYRSIIMR